MSNILSVITDIAQKDPKLAFEALLKVRDDSKGTKMVIGPHTPKHLLSDGSMILPHEVRRYGEEGETIEILWYVDGTTRIRIHECELTVVHCPHVIVGKPHYVADPNFETVRITGMFDEVDTDCPYHEAMREELERELLIDPSMSTAGLDTWLRHHGASECFLSTDG